MFVIFFEAFCFVLTYASVPNKLSLTELSRTIVTLPHGGILEGIEWRINDMSNVSAFLGIPYAKPPLGDLRFKPPVKADQWNGKRDASQMPKTCTQPLFGDFDHNNLGAVIWINNTVMDEDCLYLNVWTPTENLKNQGSLPVMVWIYGGGFCSGTSTLEVYDGRFLSAMEEVVVVSMQYRLGPLGFLFIGSEVEGNMGLRDQQLALQWVKENIAKFGGNPNKVTIFGESAGSVSVGLQYLVPSSRPLFKRMIMESASPLNRWALSTQSQAYETGIAVSFYWS